MAKKVSSKKTRSSAKAVKKAKAPGKLPGKVPVRRNVPPGKAANAPVGKSKKARKPTKFVSPLTKAELRKFREMLLEKRRDLVGDMNGIEAEALRKDRQDISSDLSTLPTHPADIGTDNYEQEFTLGLLESERSLLKEINEALQRIEEGTFGVCVGTGKPIGKARLMARPWSKYCIDYARMVEKGAVRPDQASDRPDADQEDAEEDEDVLEENSPEGYEYDEAQYEVQDEDEQ